MEFPTSCPTKVTVDGVEYSGYQAAKPMNFDKECMTDEERQEMAQLVLDGKAIAVCYFEDLSEEEQVAYVRENIK